LKRGSNRPAHRGHDDGGLGKKNNVAGSLENRSSIRDRPGRIGLPSPIHYEQTMGHQWGNQVDTTHGAARLEDADGPWRVGSMKCKGGGEGGGEIAPEPDLKLLGPEVVRMGGGKRENRGCPAKPMSRTASWVLDGRLFDSAGCMTHRRGHICVWVREGCGAHTRRGLARRSVGIVLGREGCHTARGFRSHHMGTPAADFPCPPGFTGPMGTLRG